MAADFLAAVPVAVLLEASRVQKVAVVRAASAAVAAKAEASTVVALRTAAAHFLHYRGRSSSQASEDKAQAGKNKCSRELAAKHQLASV